MSAKEIDRLGVVSRVLDRRLTRVKAAALLGLNERQVRRLCAAFEASGARGLVSGRRGKPSNNRMPKELRARAVDLIRERYADFGPTLAAVMSRNLVVHYKRVSYLVEPTDEALGLRRRQITILEWQDGRVEIQCEGRSLPYSAVDKQPHVNPGDVVENKRLGAVLATIQAAQTKRDEARLASAKLTVLKKERLRAALPPAAPSAPGQPPRKHRREAPARIVLDGVDPKGPVQAFLDQFAVDQAERTRHYIGVTNERKRQREFAARVRS